MTKKTSPAILEKKRDIAREQAILATPIRMDGVGEDPIIKAVASPEFASGPNLQAADIAVALQTLIRGQAGILANQDGMAQELAKLREKMQKYDDDAKKWDEDRVKFLEDVNRKADKLRITDPSKRAELAARVMNEEREIGEIARAEAVTARLAFNKLCETSPKVTVVGRGTMESGFIGDTPIVRLAPDVIRIKNRTWTLQPGIPTEVPEFVAKRYEQILRDREELQARQNVLRADRNDGAMSSAESVAAELAKINQKYGTTPDPRS